jgi:hypothetical protein
LRCHPAPGPGGETFLEDLVAEVHTLVADTDAGTGDELVDVTTELAAERADLETSELVPLRSITCEPPHSRPP